MEYVLLIAGATSLLALLFVAWLVIDVLKNPCGNETMIQISNAVQEGARAFLKREYTYIAVFVAAIFALMAFVPFMVSEEKRIAVEASLGWQTGVSFLIGALASAIAGFAGMSIATKANCRTAAAALHGIEVEKNPEYALKRALSVAISGGAVMGMCVVGVGLLGLVLVIWIWGLEQVHWINGYAMGASLVALFARSGGGIFTKGADMGADLVGKVEAGIPEDDPRNPATIADNVGDNVGDVAGLGADLMESYIESMIATMAISATLGVMAPVGIENQNIQTAMQLLPLMIAAVGIFASMIGILYVKFMPGSKVQNSLMNGTYLAAALSIVGTFAVCRWVVPDGFSTAHTTYADGAAIPETIAYTWWGLGVATTAGVIAGALVGFFSEYYTSASYSPVKNMARKSQMGPAITVTEGLAVGMKSCLWPTVVLGLAMLIAYQMADYYGIALAALGMLATTGMIVAVDSYGPIADNAGGCAEMAHLNEGVREVTDNLDSVGNTTAAIGKGFAIGSAAFAALGLLVAYMSTAGIQLADLGNVKVIFGLLIGGMMPFYFSALLFDAVSSSAFKMIDEVRRQFREIPGILSGDTKPDYANCVLISTDGAIRGMLVPGMLAIVMPPLIGFIFGGEALAGFLIGALVTGIMLGIMCANSGGAMDNAKKYIESNSLLDTNGETVGKGSEAHIAAVIGDTVGDPLKDTVGPSINILIKLMAVIALVLAPLMTMS